MSMEDAAVVAKDGTVKYWHSPGNRSYAALPDSPELWDVIWESRDEIEGVAHTHPGKGYPVPSRTDLTTFEAVEKGIGRRIKWWILSSNLSVLLEWNPGNPGYDVTSFLFPENEPPWMGELRGRSFPGPAPAGAPEDNVCEHGDHPAPEGKRFCSEACARCESESLDEETGCDGICSAASGEGGRCP